MIGDEWTPSDFDLTNLFIESNLRAKSVFFNFGLYSPITNQTKMMLTVCENYDDFQFTGPLESLIFNIMYHLFQTVYLNPYCCKNLSSFNNRARGNLSIFTIKKNLHYSKTVSFPQLGENLWKTPGNQRNSFDFQ